MKDNITSNYIELNILNKILNKKLSNKFDWFKGIELTQVGVNDNQNYLYMNGDIYLDEDWVGNQWRKYHDYKELPFFGDNSDYTFGDLIGSSDEWIDKLKEMFISTFNTIHGGKPPKYLSFSWINVHPVEIDKDDDNFLEENFTKILKENTNINSRVRRRINLLDDELLYRMSAIYRPDNICRYVSGEELLEVIIEAVIDAMYFTYFSDMDDNTGEWGESYYFMYNYMKDKYGDKIKEYYHINCGN